MAANRPARILVCPQEFKGSLTAIQSARAIADGVRAVVGRDAAIRELPLGDGGPGTVDAFVEATGAERVAVEVTDHLGGSRLAEYALLKDEVGLAAVIESAAACGLVLVAPEDRRPGIASTFGVGQLVADALERGARRIVVGVGGTGTNDGGAGAARALGLALLDRNGTAIPDGVLGLVRLARIDGGGVVAALGEAELRIAVDVTNELLGDAGATAIYGPQKGVRDWEVPAFDAALAAWADRIEGDLGLAVAALPGAGAGGGLPAGLLAAAHAAGARCGIESGAALVADLVGLRAAILEAELVITGEGSIDRQTAYGKTVGHVAALAADLDRPCIAVGGLVSGVPDGVRDSEGSTPSGVSVEAAMAMGAEPVRAAAERLVRRWVEAGSRDAG